jgi:peptidyl-prolyl cis-trans isomerase D
MLLEYMRKKTKTFLYFSVPLIVVAFVFWGSFPGLGEKSQRTLIKVGDEKVTMQEFVNYYKEFVEQMRANLAGSNIPNLEEMLNLKEQALDGMVREILLKQEIERLNIIVSDEELQDALKRDPTFYTDGKFDPAKWNAAVSSPRIDLIAESAREILTMQKFAELVQSAARVTEEEMAEEYRRQNEETEVEFVALNASEFAGDVKVSAEELASYYEEHKQQYAEPAKVKLAFVEIMKEPSEADSDAAKQHAEDILDGIRAGGDFAELAGFYSDDTATKEQGGDLGFFGRGRMVKEFEEAAFSMEPGDVSDVVKTKFGYHIIKVEGTRGEGDKKEVLAKHILVKVEPGEETLINLEERANMLASQVLTVSLEEAAAEMGLDVSATVPFDETSRAIPGIGYVPEIANILPGLPEGKASDRIIADKAFYVVEVTERIPERIPELIEVEERVRTVVEREKAVHLAEEKAEEIVKQINENGRTLADIDGVPASQELQPFSRLTPPPELVFLRNEIDVLFELPEDKAAGPFTDADTVYVVVSKGVTPPDPEKYDAAKGSIKDRLLVERGRQILMDYYDNLRENAEVEINRELFDAA